VSAKEDNRDKFVRLAESRVTKTIKDIRSLGKLSDRSNYTYDEQDVRKIIATLRSEIINLQQRFDNSKSDRDINFEL